MFEDQAISTLFARGASPPAIRLLNRVIPLSEPGAGFRVGLRMERRLSRHDLVFTAIPRLQEKAEE